MYGVSVDSILSIGVLVFLFAAVIAMAVMGRATSSIAGSFVGLAVVCFGAALFVFFEIRHPKDDFTPTLVSLALGAGGIFAMWSAFQLSLHKATSTYEQSIRRPDGSSAAMKVQHVVQGRGAYDSHTRFIPEVQVLDTGQATPKQLPSRNRDSDIVQEFENIPMDEDQRRAFMEGHNRRQGGKKNRHG